MPGINQLAHARVLLKTNTRPDWNMERMTRRHTAAVLLLAVQALYKVGGTHLIVLTGSGPPGGARMLKPAAADRSVVAWETRRTSCRSSRLGSVAQPPSIGGSQRQMYRSSLNGLIHQSIRAGALVDPLNRQSSIRGMSPSHFSAQAAHAISAFEN